MEELLPWFFLLNSIRSSSLFRDEHRGARNGAVGEGGIEQRESVTRRLHVKAPQQQCDAKSTSFSAPRLIYIVGYSKGPKICHKIEKVIFNKVDYFLIFQFTNTFSVPFTLGLQASGLWSCSQHTQVKWIRSVGCWRQQFIVTMKWPSP